MAASSLLASKFTLSGQELKHRIVLAPMTRSRCEVTEDPYDIRNSLANELHVEYYSQRAISGGLLITEGTQVSELGWGWMCAPKMIQKEHMESWKPVTEAVHEKGGIIYMQLWHLGRQSHPSFHPTTNKIVSASDVKMTTGEAKNVRGESVPHETPVPMTKEEIQDTIEAFVNASRLAKEAGFDGVEIHSANGYLIDQFLQKRTNHRTDEYGGSMDNRMRLLKEIVEGIINDDQDNFPANRIGFRLSPNGVFGDMGSDDNDVMFPYVAQQMNKYGLAYLHVMDGLGFGYHNLCPPVTMYDFRKVWDGPLMCNVALTRDESQGMLRSGTTDLVAVGRPYIANPDLADRWINNWPLNPDADYMSWWQVGYGAKGYTDYPFYEPPKEEESDEKK